MKRLVEKGEAEKPYRNEQEREFFGDSEGNVALDKRRAAHLHQSSNGNGERRKGRLEAFDVVGEMVDCESEQSAEDRNGESGEREELGLFDRLLGHFPAARNVRAQVCERA